MDTKDFLIKLSNTSSVSGCEENVSELISETFNPYADKIVKDKLNNLMCIKNGKSESDNVKIMLAAHADEIGLMVKDIDDNGFIYFTMVGGVDQRTLIASEVTIHGKEDLYGIIGSKPHYLQEASEKSNAKKMEDLIIDVGLGKEEVKEIVEIGDYISLRRKAENLISSILTGKALDDKAGIAVMYETAKEIDKLKHESDIYYVSTVQEEVGTRGAIVSAYSIKPDIAIVIDVGFGKTPELSKEDSIELGKGPAITLGGNVHPKLRKKIVEVAKEYNIPFQYEVEVGLTGTDARSILISRAGVPCVVISLPLKYMHTTVETIDMNDIKNSGKLIARFISSITNENVEELLCY